MTQLTQLADAIVYVFELPRRRVAKFHRRIAHPGRPSQDHQLLNFREGEAERLCAPNELNLSNSIERKLPIPTRESFRLNDQAALFVVSYRFNGHTGELRELTNSDTMRPCRDAILVQSADSLRLGKSLQGSHTR